MRRKHVAVIRHASGICFESTALKEFENTAPDLDHLESILGYKFIDRVLLERAVTHRSWAHENVAPGDEEGARKLHNESLEFLGDSVLGLVVANYLCESYPAGSEGELSRMKHRLVSAPTLAKASRALDLGQFLRFGRGEEKSGGRQKNALLADVFEAVTGAIFRDGGLVAATAFVAHALQDELQCADPLAAAQADYKTMLQEKLQAERRHAPRYSVIETEGPPHRRTFHVEVSWDNGSIQGAGHSIKSAEAAAAKAALQIMQMEEAEDSSLGQSESAV
ncbi:MAG: ribonuclease III [Blastocatellia bacterium]|nr:MAG: ribonuclease III [Blastocatellia bacterium]